HNCTLSILDRLGVSRFSFRSRVPLKWSRCSTERKPTTYPLCSSKASSSIGSPDQGQVLFAASFGSSLSIDFLFDHFVLTQAYRGNLALPCIPSRSFQASKFPPLAKCAVR